MKRLHIHIGAVSLAVLFTGYSALAQQASGSAAVGVQGNVAAPAQAPVAAPAPVPPPTGVSPDTAQAPAAQQNQAGMPLPAATNANAPTGNSDHDEMVGHLAVGYLGRNTIPYGAVPGGAANAQVPVIGVRYWLDPMIGLDLGAGLLIGGASSEATNAGVTGPSVSGPRPTSFVLHAGVPLALASSKHFAFEIIPEANFGYAKVAQDIALNTNGNGTTKEAGTHFDLGARAGAEIHFGFIGIPQLSLVGSVGLRFQYDKLTTDFNPAAGPTTASVSQWSLGTTVNESPWNIFVSNVSALYYL